LSDFFKRRLDIAFGKADLVDPGDIRKLSATFLKENDRPPEPQLRLEEANLVNDVLSCMLRAVRVFVFRCHDEEGEGGAAKQLLKSLVRREAGR
jgi:hypothetical protein